MGSDRKRRRSKSRSRSRSRDRDHRRRRSRSRSRDRERRRRNRSRDRDRDRERKKEERRSSRSRSRDRNDRRGRDKHSSSSKSNNDNLSAVLNPEKDLKLDKDKEQEKLELEMQKRRERIEKWRAEKRKKEMEALKEEVIQSKKVIEGKVWSLEDDAEDADEDEEGNVASNKSQEEEVDEDPLDAYMNTIQKEVKKFRGRPKSTGVVSLMGAAAKKAEKSGDSKDEGNKKKSIIMMSGVAKKKENNAPKRGELMEQNQDGLEYSSEEEKEEDLEGAMDKLAKKGKKDLAMVDHNKIEYLPFEKDFYREVPEIAKMSNEEVEQYRADMEGIKVKGKKVPRPFKTWPQCGVSTKILDILKKNFEKPTPIQAQAIPVVMSGRDMMGIAKTGSGKTLAFLLPLFRHINAQPELEDDDGPIAIIMTPTRELCLQIGREIKRFQRAIRGARSVCVYGGTGISEQIAELKRGAEIIVCTPGRMIDMLAANGGRVTNLRRVTFLVLDEADRMFDMGFEPQVMRIIDNCRPDKQVVLFSATFPRQMEALARRILVRPIEVQVGGRSVVCKDIEQTVHVIDEDQKFLKLLEVLGRYLSDGVAIIFVDKQEHADSLLKDLMNASYTSCGSLHGGIDQYDRDSIITQFKNGKLRILVATSVAARGLDVKQLVLVVNYDCPNHYEDYVHRCGRTGRAGSKGYAQTFITPEQGRYAGEISKAMELSETVVPNELRELWETYKNKATAEGKTIKTGSGFGGSGFKFDESEAAYTSEKKKFQKTVFGLQDSDDEDVEAEIDDQIEALLDPKRSVKTVSASEAAASGLIRGVNVAASAAASNSSSTSANGNGDTSTADKLAAAKLAAAKINLKNTPKGMVQASTESYLAGKGQTPLITAKTVADHLAAKLNAKLNYQPSDEPPPHELDGQGGFQKYEEELIINDFPQQARWRVTSKEALAQISEYSDAGITVRGTYFPPGKAVPEGDRKLFLAIESTNELSVQKAKVEITRLLKEELMKMQTSGIHHINKGRYKVL